MPFRRTRFCGIIHRVTRPALFASLSYRDAARALDSLAAIGFEVVARQDGPDGTVIHSEMRFGSELRQL